MLGFSYEGPDWHWMEQASCVSGRFAELPWVADLSRAPRVRIAAMRAVCEACPVLSHCRAYVVEADVTAGFWAGQSRNGLSVSDHGQAKRVRRAS